MSRGKILIVDDKKLLRDSLREFLESHDYQVFECETGERAVEFLRSNEADIVLMDEILPGIDGLKTLQLIKKLKSQQIVIGLSGEITVKLIEDYLSSGAYDILAKSAIYEKLLPLLEEARQHAATARSAAAVDYLLQSEQLKKEGRWEEAAVFLKEAGIEEKLLGNLAKAQELFLEAIKCFTRAGRTHKSKEVEQLMYE
jgi:DNA-binding NtrC family response regulator